MHIWRTFHVSRTWGQAHIGQIPSGDSNVPYGWFIQDGLHILWFDCQQMPNSLIPNTGNVDESDEMESDDEVEISDVSSDDEVF